MIVVRDVFQLHFGKARDALAVVREMRAAMEPPESPWRVLTDLTGDYYTLVLEMEYENAADWERHLKDDLQAPEFRELYPRLVPLVRSGRREIFTLVE